MRTVISMAQPIISTSGVRGVVGESFSPEILARFALAFGSYINGGKVIIGRDSRSSGEMAKHAVVSALMATGCEVIDVGICPTPTVLLIAKELKSDGSVTITASHNPIEYNGLEFAGKCGSLLNSDELQKLINIYQSGKFQLKSYASMGSYQSFEGAVEIHLSKILKIVDVKLIRPRKFKVVLDCCNGAGAVISSKLLKNLGCELIELNCQPDGLFPRDPEPTPKNLGQLSSKVIEEAADIGFAHDGDADRLAIVSDTGETITEDYTLAIAAKGRLKVNRGAVVTTVSASRLIDDIAAEYQVPIYRTKVGVSHVVQKMKEVGAIIGGEPTGGVIYPQINYTSDGIASIAVILQFLAEADSSVSHIISEMPKYYVCRKKLEAPTAEIADKIIKAAFVLFENEKVDLTDGLKIIWDESWLNIRKSGTEPVVRIFAEAKTSEEAERLCNWTIEQIRK
jgi:phosphomannomutase